MSFISSIENNILKSQLDTATLSLDILKSRTKRGIDRFGRNFVNKKNGTPSNLVDTGAMLNSIRVRTSKNEIIIEFNDNTQESIANYHIQGTENLPERDFLGFTDSEMDEIIDNYLDDIFE